MANALLAKDPAETCVLVTGGAGFIGSHTVVELLESGYGVVVVDNLSNSNKESMNRVKKITGKSPVFYEADVRDRAAMEKIFTENKIDYVIHFAGLKAVGESCVKPIEYYDNNLYGTLVLLEVMREHGCKKIVFSSSATVYGTPERLPLDESCRTGGTTNPYGTSKYFQEIMLNDVYKADNEWTVVLLRYFNPVGAHPSGLIGEDHTPETHLIPLVLQAAQGKRESVSIFGTDYPTPDGTCIRDYIHVTDLAQAHILALDYLMKGGDNNVFNLGNGVGFSVNEVIEVARAVTGHPIPAEVSPRRAGDPAQLIASSEKAKSVLGWKPQYDDLNTIVSSAWNWHKAHPHGYEK